MNQQHCFWDSLAAWLGVTCDDWDTDFAGDGYTDFWGRAPLDEPLWWEPAEEMETPDQRNVTIIPVPPRRGRA